MATMATTSSTAVTYWARPVPWRDTTVVVLAPNQCRHPEGLAVMHHYDDAGHHYCPTGFLYCPVCFEETVEPDPPSCQRWGE